MASRDELLARAEVIYGEVLERGFSISSGAAWTVIGIPAVSGSNEELVAKNAANTAQMAVWNAELATIWGELGLINQATASLTPIENPWGSAGKPVPSGYTINYGSLFQEYQNAVAQQNWTLAEELARRINAITAAGPVLGGFVPVVGVDSQGQGITPGGGIVYTEDGVVVAPGSQSPTSGGGTPDPWETVTGSDPHVSDPVFIPGDPTADPSLGDPSLPAGGAGEGGPVGVRRPTSTMVDTGEDLTANNVAGGTGPLSTVSGKVVLIVLVLVGAGIWFAMRAKPASS